MKSSSFLNLNWQDLRKGFIVAVLTAVLGSLYPIIESGRFPSIIELKTIGGAALLAGVAYLIKNLFTGTPSTIVIDPAKTDVVDKNTKKVIA